MIFVYTTNKDNFAELHIFKDFDLALSYAASRHDEEFIQSISIIYEKVDNVEVEFE